jgi:hypothetical protein
MPQPPLPPLKKDPKPPREEDDEVLVLLSDPLPPQDQPDREEDPPELEPELEARLQTSSANLSCRARAAAHSSLRVGQANQAPPAAPAPSRTRVMAVGRRTREP